MVKVSISLPNNTQIVLETEEAELLHDVVRIALRDLPRYLMQPVQDTPPRVSNGTAEKGTDVIKEHNKPGDATHEPSRIGSGRLIDAPPAGGGNLRLDEQTARSRDDFVSFCQNVNPSGDMRRVVVAAEGAGRYFDAEGIDAEDLDCLFGLAGWRRPGNFTQTLRNAARAKFGWLERIPGRSGRYTVTDLGRSVTEGHSPVSNQEPIL